MAYIEQFSDEFKQNLLQLRLNISMVTDDKIKKSLVKDNIESHIISALTLGAKQFIDTYFFCVLKVLNGSVKIEDLKTESIFNKYKNKFKRRFLDIFGDLDVIFTNGTDLDLDYITIFKNSTLINTLIERNREINQFNSNYSKLELLPNSKSTEIEEFKVSLKLKKDDWENSNFSKAMGENIKINGTIKPNVKGEETKLFCKISGFSDSKTIEIESEPTREEFYKGEGGHNGFLMFVANLFKPTIEYKIFDYLKNKLNINITQPDIIVNIENNVFTDKSKTDIKDIQYKLTVINPKDGEKDIKGVVKITKDIKTLGLKYDLNSTSYIYGYKENEKIDKNYQTKDLLVKFEKTGTNPDTFKPTDDIEEFEKLLTNVINLLEFEFKSKYNKDIKLKVVRDEIELSSKKETPNSELKKTEIKEELIAEYDVKISGEGSSPSKEQPIGIFKVGTKGRIVEAINKKVSLSGAEYLKKTHDNILDLQKSFQKTKKIRIDGIVGDETWVPVFGYDRTLVNGNIKIYSDGIKPYYVATLSISDKKIELTSNKSEEKKVETPKEEPSLIDLNLNPGTSYSSEGGDPVAKIIIIKNDNLKSGYGKIENLKGGAIIQFNTPFQDSTVDKITDDVINGLKQKLDSTYPNFATITKKEVINNDVNTDVITKKDEAPITDIDKLSTNALIDLEKECLNQKIITFLTKIEKPVEIILKGDGDFTIFVESPKNDNTSKITGEIGFMSTNSAITGMCEISGLPSNYTNPNTKVVVTTSEYMYTTSQSPDTPEDRIKLGNEALVYFQNKIKVDYDLDIKLALRDKFAEKLEPDSSSNPILTTKYSELDGEWIFNVEKENIFYHKDFGELKIIGDVNTIERKMPDGLDDEYTEEEYGGESEVDYSDEHFKNQQDLMADLTFEIAFENQQYIEKSRKLNATVPSSTTVTNEPGSPPVVEVNDGTITPVGKFQLYGGAGSQRVINMIYKGESGGKVGIFNYLPKYHASKKDMMDAVRIDNMTLSELYKYMTKEVHPKVGGLIWATGVFQIIPDTLKGNINKYKISWDRKYDAKMQQEFGEYLIFNHAGNYLKGKNSGSKEDLAKAITLLAGVWASLPTANRTKFIKSGNFANLDNGGGNTGYYGGDGVNPSKVHTEVGTVVINLIKARIELSGSKPSYIPDYAKNL